MTSSLGRSLDDEGVGWILIGDPASRGNLLTRTVCSCVARDLYALLELRAKAVIIASANDRFFSAGADLNLLGQFPSAGVASDFSRAGQNFLRVLSEFPIPIVCAIHGVCAGGGFELALACQWRIASNDAGTQIGLPEARLGTLPGWGGCVRLPRLIGASAALDHILGAKLISTGAAVDARLVDEVTPAAEIEAAAKAAALRLSGAGKPLRIRPPIPPVAYFEKLRQKTLLEAGRGRPELLKIIDVVAEGMRLSLDAALEVEARAFGEVTVGEACKSRIRAFLEAKSRRISKAVENPRSGS